jgi:hypothetical protein
MQKPASSVPGKTNPIEPNSPAKSPLFTTVSYQTSKPVDGFAELLGIPSDGRASGFRALQQTLSASERSETALPITVYF